MGDVGGGGDPLEGVGWWVACPVGARWKREGIPPDPAPGGGERAERDWLRWRWMVPAARSETLMVMERWVALSPNRTYLLRD